MLDRVFPSETLPVRPNAPSSAAASPKLLWSHSSTSFQSGCELDCPASNRREYRMRSNAKLNRRLVAQYQKWMVAMHYATVTKSMYLKVLNSFLIFLGERSLIRVTHTDIRLFIADASENGATLSTVYRSLGVLRQFYDFLNLGGVVDYVAPRFVRLRVPWRNSLRVLNQEQVRRVISATRTRREKALIEFFYSSGCRLSEAIHLKIQDIDFQARQARVRGKLGKVRLVLIAESAANALLAYIGA